MRFKNNINMPVNHWINSLRKALQIFRSLGSKSESEEKENMKYLIVGLGNIGDKFTNTRHNIGFRVLDDLAIKNEVVFETDRLGDLIQLRKKGRTIYFLKPSTFMNLSGRAIRYWKDKLKIPFQNMLIIVDDINLPFDSVRMRGKGSHGGHNGLENVEEKLQSRDYPRIRIGIGDQFSKGRQIDYVLGEWSSEEEKHLPSIITHVHEMIWSFVFRGLGPTMSEYNKKEISSK